ncbi:MAG: protein phosphatase 2C domain-containing protein, partial [Ruminococcus sp.]|nr:protein phosphatase 2C domain-containing protein [Ruminococcus sp.]
MWKIYSASQKGDKPNHEICQDVYNEVTRETVNCVAVCDGASSGIHSELGAELISKFLSEYFAENFDIIWNNSTIENQSMIDDLHGDALLKLSEYVASKGYSPIVDNDFMISKEELDKYCTTVQLIAVKNNQVIIYKIGNGSIAYIEDDKVKLLSKSEHDDLTSHFTYMNTIDTVINSQLRKYTITDNITGFVIMSDGVDFEGGMCHNECLTENMLLLINNMRENDNPSVALSDCISNISKHQTNISNDDITISVLLRDSIKTVIEGFEKTDDEFCNIITSLGNCNDKAICLVYTADADEAARS